MFNIWINMFQIFVRSYVLIHRIRDFLFFIILYDLFFVFINKVSVIVGIVHIIYVVICVNKMYWVQLRFINGNCSSGRTWA